MLHHIIAKFTPEVQDKAALIREIEELFSASVETPGVHGVSVRPNVVNRSNRYDVMIVLDIDQDCLENWDNAHIHHVWKEKYGKLLEKKAIFDCN